MVGLCIDERVILVVSPPREHAIIVVIRFLPCRMLANADTGVDHDELAVESKPRTPSN